MEGPATFRVVLTGKVLPGAVEDEVRANLAALYRAPVAKVEALLSGTPRVVHSGLRRERAEALRAALEKAGVQARVEPEEEVAPEPAGRQPQPADVATTGNRAAGEPGAEPSRRPEADELRARFQRARTTARPAVVARPRAGLAWAAVLNGPRSGTWALVAGAGTLCAVLLTWFSWAAARAAMPGMSPLGLAAAVVGLAGGAAAVWRGSREGSMRPLLVGLASVVVCVVCARALVLAVPKERSAREDEEMALAEYEADNIAYLRAKEAQRRRDAAFRALADERNASAKQKLAEVGAEIAAEVARRSDTPVYCSARARSRPDNVVVRSEKNLDTYRFEIQVTCKEQLPSRPKLLIPTCVSRGTLVYQDGGWTLPEKPGPCVSGVVPLPPGWSKLGGSRTLPHMPPTPRW